MAADRAQAIGGSLTIRTKHAVTVHVSDIVLRRLGEKARERGLTAGGLAQRLFDAGYAALFGGTGDLVLEAKVAEAISGKLYRTAPLPGDAPGPAAGAAPAPVPEPSRADDSPGSGDPARGEAGQTIESLPGSDAREVAPPENPVTAARSDQPLVPEGGSDQRAPTPGARTTTKPAGRATPAGGRLTPSQIRSARGLRVAGHSPASVARLTGLPLALVREALR